MLPEYQVAIVKKNTLLAQQVRHLTVELPMTLSFLPGQFFLVRLRSPSGDFVERSYSAANAVSGPKLEFIVRIEAKGQMSCLIDQLKPSVSIDVKGPFGRFGVQSIPHDTEKLVLIAGGVGISPFRSLLHDFRDKQWKNPLQLFYGFRTSEDFLFQKEFETMKENMNLSIITALSEADKKITWIGNKGFISDFFEGRIFTPDVKTHALICGPPLMVKAAREKLANLGYAKTHIHLEAW